MWKSTSFTLIGWSATSVRLPSTKSFSIGSISHFFSKSCKDSSISFWNNYANITNLSCVINVEWKRKICIWNTKQKIRLERNCVATNFGTWFCRIYTSTIPKKAWRGVPEVWLVVYGVLKRPCVFVAKKHPVQGKGFVFYSLPPRSIHEIEGRVWLRNCNSWS